MLGGRKLRYKDMGSVMPLASGHIRTFDLFCLNLARESLPWHMQGNCLHCPAGDRLLKGQDRNTEVEKQSGSIKPEIYKIK